MSKKRRDKSEDGSHWAKTENLLIRLHPDEKATFKEAANYAGIALSVWVRDRLCEIARQELEEATMFAPLRKKS